MDKIQNNQFGMFTMLSEFFREKSTLYSSNTALVDSVSDLNDIISDVRTLDSKTTKRGAYSTETKQIRKGELANGLLTYHAKLRVWLRSHDDPDAPMEIRLAPSGIKYANDDRILVIASKTYDYVEGNLAALTAYGFNATTQTTLKDLTDAFEEMSDMPLRELNNRSADNEKIADLMEKGRLLVREDIRIYMGPYQFTNPQFHFGFTQAARLGKPGTRTMALRVKISSTANLPLMGCKVVVQPSRKGSKPLKAETKKAGRVQFQHMPKGKCTITATMPGGESQQQQAEIIASERADVLFVF